MDSFLMNVDKTFSEICKRPSFEATNSLVISNIFLVNFGTYHTKNVTEQTIHSSEYDWFLNNNSNRLLPAPKQLPANGYEVFIQISKTVFAKIAVVPAQRIFTPCTNLHI